MTTHAPSPAPSTCSRVAVFLYGVAGYAVGVAGLGWLIAAAFGVVPFSAGPVVVESTVAAVLWNLGLVALFGVQHTIMARPRFKEAWARVLPAAAARPTFTALAGALMGLALWLWQPLPQVVWHAEDHALRVAVLAVAALAWAYLLLATFAIDHFELFGLRQAWRHLVGHAAQPVPFVRRLMYRFDRHPIMTGFVVALWAAPTMTVGHLVLAAGFTAYAVVGVAIEERDLIRAHGERYLAYKREVGSIVPTPRRGSAAPRAGGPRSPATT